MMLTILRLSSFLRVPPEDHQHADTFMAMDDFRGLIIPCVLGLIIQQLQSNKALHPTRYRP
ncbi:hypothetical protein [Oceaniferula spumae]|uniref:hypothetical protein n=1 Tax=Oceaniferula spumae TaxID=2979115 RepID=UPI003F4EEB07